MKNEEKKTIKDESSNSIDKNQQGIEDHKKVATHLEAAAKSHREAAKHHEEGNHEKAAQSAVVANDHLNQANKG